MLKPIQGLRGHCHFRFRHHASRGIPALHKAIHAFFKAQYQRNCPDNGCGGD
jgi:hypothetical protein